MVFLYCCVGTSRCEDDDRLVDQYDHDQHNQSVTDPSDGLRDGEWPESGPQKDQETDDQSVEQNGVLFILSGSQLLILLINRPTDVCDNSVSRVSNTLPNLIVQEERRSAEWSSYASRARSRPEGILAATILKPNRAVSMKLNETQWNSMKLNETQWNSMKLNETQWNSMKLNETTWN